MEFWRECSLGIRLIYILSRTIPKTFCRFLKHNDLEHPTNYFKIMYYFVYYINTIALYGKGKPTSLTNKNKEIDNSPIKIAQWVNAEGPKWKNALNHDYKNNYGRNFQCKIFSFIDFVFTNWRNLSGNGQMGLWQIFQSPIFALSGKKCCY